MTDLITEPITELITEPNTGPNTGPEPTMLLGRWTLRRRLVDRRLGLWGHVTGTLELSGDDHAVRWHEAGEFTWDGVTHPVTRDLALVPDESGWSVLFDDRRPFHRWRPGTTVEHPCRADLYRGHIDVAPSLLSMRVLWDVTGPDKHQRIVTRCRRTGT